MNEIEEVIEQLKERTEKFGLYLKHTIIAGSDDSDEDDEGTTKLSSDKDLKDRIASGELNVVVFATFTVGDLAFDDRIQDPAGYEQEVEFKTIMPSEHEVAMSTLREKIAKGGDLLDLLDDEDEDEDV